jgi:trimethylamine--corrinoid protein Co-methyltransferase
MLDFESCISLEKLVLDNEICGMTFRLLEGIEPKEDFPALPHFQELLGEGHLIIAEHTRKYLREEHLFPGASIDRANRPRWEQEGSTTLEERAHGKIEKLLEGFQPSRIDGDTAKELVRLMEGEAQRHGMDRLPERVV